MALCLGFECSIFGKSVTKICILHQCNLHFKNKGYSRSLLSPNIKQTILDKILLFCTFCDHHSNIYTLQTSDVPIGSPFSPILFNFYINTYLIIVPNLWFRIDISITDTYYSKHKQNKFKKIKEAFEENSALHLWT